MANISEGRLNHLECRSIRLTEVEKANENVLYQLQKADVDCLLEDKVVTDEQRENIYERVRKMDASHDFEYIELLIDEELKGG